MRTAFFIAQDKTKKFGYYQVEYQGSGTPDKGEK